jgi:GH15 family glucan-1,4-alpha-glucosidase
VCRHGFDAELNSFVQSDGAMQLDASLLLVAASRLPTGADDPSIGGTIHAIEEFLLRDCFVARYNTESGTDGLPGNEGAFLACSKDILIQVWISSAWCFFYPMDVEHYQRKNGSSP